MKALVSIVVPVYNGEPYLGRLLNCLLNQTYKNLEFVFVDDFSTDGSMSILKYAAQKDSRIKIYTNNKKAGNAAKGIEFALSKVSGDFYFYLSQDDFIDLDLIEKCVRKAVLTGADICIPNMIWYEGKDKENKKYGKFPLNSNYDQILSSREAFVESLTWQIHCFMLVSMKLIKSQGFKAKLFNSDEYYSRKNLLDSNFIVFANTNFYYNQNNASSITRTEKVQNIDWLATDLMLIDLLFEYKFIYEIKVKMIKRVTNNYLKEKRKLCLYKNVEEKKYFESCLKDSRRKLLQLSIQMMLLKNIIKIFFF